MVLGSVSRTASRRWLPSLRAVRVFVVAGLFLLGPAVGTSRAATAAVLGPIGGSVSSPASSHPISFGGDWSMDIAGSGDVVVRLSSPHAVSLRVEQVSAACAGGRQGASAVRVRVLLDGASVAVLVYAHVADVAVGAGQTIGNGTRLGRVATGLPYNSSCWTGPHVHVEARNDAGYACYTPLGVGAAINGGTTIGQVGAVGAGGIRAPCGSPPPTGTNPAGAYDLLASPSPGTIRVAGWGFDRDAPAAPIQMHVYVGGPAGQAGAEGHAFVADGSRPDVAAVHAGVGASHGLDQTFETSKRGSQSVCLYAINIGGGDNVALGCKSVTIGDPNPVGAYDLLSSPVGGQVRVAGWAFDPNAPTAAVQMHVYVGGEAGQPGAEGHAFIANGSRPDVAKVHSGVGPDHGLDRTFATAKRGAQRVCLYAITIGPGVNVPLGCKTVGIAEAPTSVSTTASPASTPSDPEPATATVSGAASSAGPVASSSRLGLTLPTGARRGQRLMAQVTGIDDGATLTLRWTRRGARALQRRVVVRAGRIPLRAPSHRGSYTLSVRLGAAVIAKGHVRVR